jgi:hypothetical protein
MRLHAIRLLTLCLALFFWRGAARAQAPPDESILKARTTDARFRELLRGEKQMTADDGPLVAAAARYYVQRIALLAQKEKPAELRNYLKAFEAVVKLAEPNPKKPDAKTKEVQQAFAEESVKALKDVLKLPFKQWTTAVLWGSFELEPLGSLGQPVVADFLAELVKDSKNDITRLYALKGLSRYYQFKPPEIHSFTGNDERLREAARLEPVLHYLTLPLSKSGEDEEVFRFIRREAIKVLAESHLPGVPLLDSKEIKAQVAYGLVRVLAEGKDGLDPSPSLSERAEAALGLCQLKADADVGPRPQSKLVLALVGKTLVDLSHAYFNDQDNFKSTLPPLLTWKVYGNRFKLALQDLKANLPAADQPASDKLAGAASFILNAMSSHTKITDSNIQVLQEAVKGLAAPGPSIYEGRAEPKLDLAK